MAYATDTRSLGATLGQNFSNMRTALGERWSRYKTYRTTRDELFALTDRELADLGIARASIQSIATFAAYGDK